MGIVTDPATGLKIGFIDRAAIPEGAHKRPDGSYGTHLGQWGNLSIGMPVRHIKTNRPGFIELIFWEKAHREPAKVRVKVRAEGRATGLYEGEQWWVPDDRKIGDMPKPIKCDICGAGPFKHPAPLARHKRDAHGIAGSSRATISYHKAKEAAPKSQTPEETLRIKKLMCDFPGCGQGPFAAPQGLGAHKKTVHKVAGASYSSTLRRERNVREQAAGGDFNRINANLDALKGVRKSNGSVSLDEAITALETKRDSDYRAANEAIAYLKEMRNQ